MGDEKKQKTKDLDVLVTLELVIDKQNELLTAILAELRGMRTQLPQPQTTVPHLEPMKATDIR